MDLPNLTPHEARVLGSLVEKELTTPDYYPLSLNALVNACNQINNRQPVLSLTETEVKTALESLRDQRLAVVISGGDNRVLKYAHRAAEALELPRAELALVCELLLRGAQTPGELRSRAGRMHAFADLPDVLATLGRLAARTPPLVAVLPRQPGVREARYLHLLSGTVGAASNPSSPTAVPADEPRRSPAEQRGHPPAADRLARLEAEIESIKSELAALKAKISP